MVREATEGVQEAAGSIKAHSTRRSPTRPMATLALAVLGAIRKS
jgi:hypothetical protein